MEGESVGHPDRGPLGRRRKGPRMRHGLILAAYGAGGTLGGTTPLHQRVPPIAWRDGPDAISQQKADEGVSPVGDVAAASTGTTALHLPLL